MLNKDNADRWGDQNDPFGEDFGLIAPDEEIRARAAQILGDNQDALRHFVELAVWEALDKPDLLRVLLSMLWLWEAVDSNWLAEASFMTVGEVRNLAESQPVIAFNCLDCGTELRPKNRLQQIRMQQSVERYCQDEAADDLPAALLCHSCHKQRIDHAEQQRQLDDARRKEMLKDYRARPYAKRRGTREWAVLKRQIHRRDLYRCRLCGSNDDQLHVHHRTYATYAEERLEDLITLCRSCHEAFHGIVEDAS